MTKRVSKATRDRMSEAKKGNQNASGLKVKGASTGVDHQKIKDRFTRECNKGSYNAAVSNSAARMMFINASDEERLNIMRLVNEVRK